jgi:protein-tyrosine phosphatase
MRNILFVCTGNINRSAAAEIMFNSIFKNIAVSRSCAINEKAGVPMSKKMAKVLVDNGFLSTDRRSVAISNDLLDWADIIIAFQPSHLTNIASRGYSSINIVDFIPGNKQKKVPDPHFDSSGDTHKVVYSMIAASLPGIVDAVEQL